MRMLSCREKCSQILQIVKFDEKLQKVFFVGGYKSHFFIVTHHPQESIKNCKNLLLFKNLYIYTGCATYPRTFFKRP